MLTNWLVSISYKFSQKGFSKQAIEIWILIPIIAQNTLKLHNKKIYTKYNKICVFEKVHMKIILVNRKLELNDPGFLCYSEKHHLACPGLYRLTFESLYHTSLVSPSKWQIDETVHFQNFRKLFQK